MPPSEQAPSTPVNNSPAMSPDMAGGAPAGDQGSVMVSMPKAAFDAIHQLVTQLAQGLDQLKQGVDTQAGKGQGAPAGPVAPSAGAPSEEASEGEQSDEDFLKGLAEEGSKR